jgi:putative Holliday junction resolvase
MNPILGIDFGQARIGLAISDELRFLAHPLQTISANRSSVNKIAEIVRDRRVEIVVVGIPRHMSGEIGAAAKAALAFADRLRTQVGCPVETWDERLSTVAAERALREAGRKTHQTRQVVDQVAAQMILQSYLDREGGTVSTAESEK